MHDVFRRIAGVKNNRAQVGVPMLVCRFVFFNTTLSDHLKTVLCTGLCDTIVGMQYPGTVSCYSMCMLVDGVPGRVLEGLCRQLTTASLGSHLPENSHNHPNTQILNHHKPR